MTQQHRDGLGEVKLVDRRLFVRANRRQDANSTQGEAFRQARARLRIQGQLELGEVRPQLIQFNPMSSVVEAFRYAYLGAGTVNLAQLGYSFGFMVVVILVGAVIFNRVEQTFMDTV
jgi:hypothetical protein